MSTRPDILVYKPNGSLVLAVDIQGGGVTDMAWAIELRRHYMETDTLSDAPYYMLMSREHAFLWTNARIAGPDAPPDYVTDTTCLLGSAYRGRTPIRELSFLALDMVVSSWLTGLTCASTEFDEVGGDCDWLKKTGLGEALQRGSLQFADAA